jgi:type IV secretory pathway VirB2 component (pilin)
MSVAAFHAFNHFQQLESKPHFDLDRRTISSSAASECVCAQQTCARSWDVDMNMMLTLVLLQAGGSPWETAVQQLQNAFTGPIAKGLSLVAIVVGGLMFAFGEGGSKRMLSGIVFGVGMAIAAVNFLSWLFPGA